MVCAADLPISSGMTTSNGAQPALPHFSCFGIKGLGDMQQALSKQILSRTPEPCRFLNFNFVPSPDLAHLIVFSECPPDHAEITL